MLDPQHTKLNTRTVKHIINKIVRGGVLETLELTPEVSRLASVALCGSLCRSVARTAEWKKDCAGNVATFK
jgi:hypothetical protein